MTTAQAISPQGQNLTVTQCETRLQTTSAMLKSVSVKLDTDTLTGLETVVSLTEAKAIVEAGKAPLSICTPTDAASYAGLLLGLYPAREVNNAAVFTRGMTALMESLPRKYVEAAVDPANGLPSTLKWLPTIAEVKKFCEGERDKRSRIMANAAYVIRKHQEAEAREADRKKWANVDMEARRKQVAALLGKNTLRQVEAE